MIRAAIAKDVQLLLRDRGALFSMFLLPLIFMGAFGLMFSGASDDEAGEGGGGRGLRLALVQGSKPEPAAQRILSALRDTKGLTLVACADRAALDTMVATRDADAGLVIPDSVDATGANPVVFVADPAMSDADSGMLQGAVMTALYRGWYFSKYAAFIDEDRESKESAGLVKTEAPAQLKKKREHIDSFQISVPGNAVLFIFFLSSAIAISFVEDRRSGTWRRMLAAPVSRSLVLTAKLVPYFVLGVLQMVFLFAMAALAFGLQISGSVPALIAVTVCLVASATALGFLMASFGGSEKQVSALTTIVVLVMALLSGCMFPRLMMPPSLRTIGLFAPHGWALDAYTDVLVRSGTTLTDVASPCLALLAFAAVFSTLAALIFRAEG